MTELYVFRLRNVKGLEAFVEEVSALADKKTLLEICNLAIEDQFSLLYVKLNSKSMQNMFYIRFDKHMQLS